MRQQVECISRCEWKLIVRLSLCHVNKCHMYYEKLAQYEIRPTTQVPLSLAPISIEPLAAATMAAQKSEITNLPQLLLLLNAWVCIEYWSANYAISASLDDRLTAITSSNNGYLFSLPQVWHVTRSMSIPYQRKQILTFKNENFGIFIFYK